MIDVRIKQVDHTPLTYEQLVQQYLNLFIGIGKQKNSQIAHRPDRPSGCSTCLSYPLSYEKVHSSWTQQSRKTRDNWESRWIYFMDISPGQMFEFVSIWKWQTRQWIENNTRVLQSMTWCTCTLNVATVFLKLDLRSGYHQSSLAPESRYITTFENPEKVHQIEFWYQFGEIFQNTISE